MWWIGSAACWGSWKMKHAKWKIVLYCGIVGAAVLTVLPFYWVILSSFRSNTEMFAAPVLFTTKLTIVNYYRLFTESMFVRWVLNSAFIGVCYTGLGLFFCSLGGFAFAKYEFRFKDTLFLILLASMMIPYFVTIVPLFVLFTKIRWVNTYQALIIPYSANPIGIFFMRGYMMSIPSDIIDSARIDGCSDFKIYYKIILPLVKPALGAVAIILLLTSWNSFFVPLIMVQTEDMYTLTLGLRKFIMQTWRVSYGQMMAASVLSTLPILVIFLKLQSSFIRGLTLGAIKE